MFTWVQLHLLKIEREILHRTNHITFNQNYCHIQFLRLCNHNDEHFENVPLPIEITLSGIVIFLSDELP